MLAGVDIGSTTTKAVLMNSDYQILAYDITLSGNNFKQSCRVTLDAALKKIGASVEDLTSIVSTGYGRYMTELPCKVITEITCCARGAHFLHPEARTIIDIGGQDTKVIRVDEHGRVIDFALNDKCAAGTGKFLERIAVSLGLGMEEMAALSLESNITLPISSTCTVFAETEVISRLSGGEPLQGIVKGLYNSLAGRIHTLAQRMMDHYSVLVCGGGSKDVGLVEELRQMTGAVLLVPQQVDPRLVPAIGAALIAGEQ